MIRYKKGNILEQEADALVNTVNCVGIMGRGVALQFKNAFPGNFKAYELACKRNDVQPGRMLVYETGAVTKPQYIINFPTKRHWRGKSRIEDIDLGLEALAEEIRLRGIRSIAIPPLGSGLGGLDWSLVRPRIEAALKDIENLEVVVFEPIAEADRGSSNPSTAAPPMTPGRAALVALIDRYLRGLLDPFVTLLEIHKLMYFMQSAGEPLKLSFAKGPYGPYAEKLRHVLKTVEGHLIVGYADGGDNPTKQLNLLPGALEDATAFLKDRPETRDRLDRVADLVEGFESPYGLELLSTVHWILAVEGGDSTENVIARTYAWSDSKKQFTRRQIGLAIQVLAQKGWAEALGD